MLEPWKKPTVWTVKNTVLLRQEFVQLGSQEDANVRGLCRRFGISPKTGDKWLGCFEAVGGSVQALQDRSRRPLNSPERSSQEADQAVLALRQQHPARGGRKIARRLSDLGQSTVAPSTVTTSCTATAFGANAGEASGPWQRFEHDAPKQPVAARLQGPLPDTCRALSRAHAAWTTTLASACA